MRPRDRRRHHHRPWPVWLAAAQVAIGYFSRSTDLAGMLFLVAGPVVLGLFARKRPALAVAGVGAVTLAYLFLGYALGPAIPSTLVAVVYAVSHGARLAAWLTLGGLWLGWLTLGLIDVRTLDSWLTELRWLGVALLAGGLAELIDNRRQRIAAYRQLYVEERRRREEEQRRREEQERLRIARELHDVLAHSLSLIAVRASVALELIDTDPGEVRNALVAIKDASKGGLAEVRSVLSGLRDPATGAAPGPAPRAPAPSLDRLDELVAETPGLQVKLTRTGSKEPVSAAVGLAGYRIIQEALTNVIRHSSARSAVVHLHQTDRLLLIGISDAGPAIGDVTSGGSGLIGIRERASALGGVAQAGPDPLGGFTVYVALPVLEGGR